MSRIGRLFRRFRSGDKPEPPPETQRARWVVAGLGNPEQRWLGSRHNTGFMVIDRLAEASRVKVSKKKFRGSYGEATIGSEPVILIKPQTYYNLSGECVSPLLSYFEVPAERLIVVHDELDLEAGRIQIKLGGGDAGNRGIRSVIESLGKSDFVRVRVGISHPDGERDTKDYILKPMTAAESALLRDSIARAAQAVEAIIVEGPSRAMNRFNHRG